MNSRSYWQRFERARISRRRILGAAGVGAASVAVLAACGGGGGGDGDENGEGNGDAVAGGVLRLSVTADWGTIDPVTSVGSSPGLSARTYNVLLDRSRRDNTVFFNDLAEKFEQPDEETYVFTMRQGVKIAPNDLGIEERDMDELDAVRWMERLDQDENAVGRAFTEPWVDSFEAPEAGIFQIKTNGPYTYFLARIGSPLGGTIPPREFFEQEISLEQQGVGGGPFVLRPGSFAENGRATVDRNPNYYQAPLPYIDSIEWTQILERQPRRTAFIDGQIDVYAAENREEMEGIRTQLPDVMVVEDPIDTYIAFNMKPTVAPWDDPLVRRAAMLALNRQEYADRIFGEGGAKPNGLVHWPLGDFALPPEELETLQPFDPTESRRLLEEAGHELPLKVKVMWPANSDIEFHKDHLEIWLLQMEAAGFEIDEDVPDFGTWLTRYQNLDYDASLALNQIYETPEIDLDWHSSEGPQGDGNFGVGIGAVVDGIDEAILASKGVTDPEEQVEAIRDVQRTIYEAAPSFLPIVSWVQFTMRQSYVKGVRDGLGATGLYFTPQWWLDKPV